MSFGISGTLRISNQLVKWGEMSMKSWTKNGVDTSYSDIGVSGKVGFFSLLCIACIIVVCMATAPASADSNPTVVIQNYTVTPSVLMPDSIGTVTVIIKNTASTSSITQKSGMATTVDALTQTTTDINVYIQNVHLEGNGIDVTTNDFARVGDIGPGQSIPITFSVRAPDQSGMYFPEVWIDTNGGQSTRYPIPVNVNTPVGIEKQAILVMESSVPGDANPGNEIPVILNITNAGQSLADDVTLNFETQNMSVAPRNSDVVHVGTINPGEEKSTDLVLLSDKNTNPGLIRLPIIISYNGVDGVVHNTTSGIDLMMKGVAEMGFVSVDTNPTRLAEGTPFDLTIRIENTGTGEAKQVSAKVDLPVDGTREAFIGKIKPGNDAPAIFLLEGAKAGNHPYNLTVQYTDDMGSHTITRAMNIWVPATDSSGTIIFGILVLGVLAFVGYRYWYLPRKNGNGSFPWERKN